MPTIQKIAGLLAAILLGACSPSASLEQRFDGSFTAAAGPVANLRVSISVSPESGTTMCPNVVASATTDAQGRFSARAIYFPADSERLFPADRYHAVCIDDQGTWRQVWSFTGPAVHELTLRCRLGEPAGAKCETGN